MFFALNEDKVKVSAWDSDKRDGKGNLINYYCPECGEQLTLRKGEIYTHHFSHKGDTTCRLSTSSGGESDIHAFMKHKIRKIIERDNNVIESEYEYRIGNMIADYYCTLKDNKGKIKKVAVEVVHKHTDIKDFIDKCEYYYSQGVYCLWIFNLDLFIYENTNKFKSSVTINKIIKNAHIINFGKIYALDRFNDIVYAIHLESIHSYNPNKKIVPHFIKELKLSYFKPFKADDFRQYNRTIASPFIKQFWTKKKWDYKFQKKENQKIKPKIEKHELTVVNPFHSDNVQESLEFRYRFTLKKYYYLGKFKHLDTAYHYDDNELIFKGFFYYSCEAEKHSIEELFDNHVFGKGDYSKKLIDLILEEVSIINEKENGLFDSEDYFEYDDVNCNYCPIGGCNDCGKNGSCDIQKADNLINSLEDNRKNDENFLNNLAFNSLDEVINYDSPRIRLNNNHLIF